MIPERYWQIATRWFWLIAIFGILFGVAAYFLGHSQSLKPKPMFSASVMLSVHRVIDAGGHLTLAGDPDVNYQIFNKYTTNLIEWTSTPQFKSRLAQRLADKNVPIARSDITTHFEVVSAPKASRTTGEENTLPVAPDALTVTGKGSDANQAAMVANEAAAVINAKAADDEKALVDAANRNFSASATDLNRRLQDAYGQLQQRLTGVNNQAAQQSLAWFLSRGQTDANTADQFRQIIDDMARASGSPELVTLQGTMESLETAVRRVISAQQAITVETVATPQPLALSGTIDTAETSSPVVVSARNLTLISVAAGLAFGWIVANLAENALESRRHATSPRALRERA